MGLLRHYVPLMEICKFVLIQTRRPEWPVWEELHRVTQSNFVRCYCQSSSDFLHCWCTLNLYALASVMGWCSWSAEESTPTFTRVRGEFEIQKVEVQAKNSPSLTKCKILLCLGLVFWGGCLKYDPGSPVWARDEFEGLSALKHSTALYTSLRGLQLFYLCSACSDEAALHLNKSVFFCQRSGLFHDFVLCETHLANCCIKRICSSFLKSNKNSPICQRHKGVGGGCLRPSNKHFAVSIPIP